MKKKIGLILAAGKQTRFKSDIPKALSLYENKTVLEHNISVIDKYVDEVYVVCSNWNLDKFKELGIENDRVKILSIDSGLGCGHGVMLSLKLIKEYSDILLLWGDSIQDDIVISRLVDSYRGYFLVPVVMEEKPYVQFKAGERHFIHNVFFSKYNHNIDEFGYHDLSVFMFDKELIYKKLYKMHIKGWTGESYNTKSGELIFLEMFNENKNLGKILKMNNVKAKSFNTLEEFDEIVKE